MPRQLVSVTIRLGVIGIGTILSAPGASAQSVVVVSSRFPEAAGGFGGSIGSIPDLDSDGRADFIVGAPLETATGLAAGGRAYVHSGQDGRRLFTLQSPANEFNGRFGTAAAGLRDLDGDGRGDVIVGAPREDPASLPQNCGRAYAFSGTGVPRLILDSPSPQFNGAFGRSVADLGDVNADGRADFVIGAWGETGAGGLAGEGRAYVFSGTGVLLRSLERPWPTPQADARFGWSVAGVPDVNADGRDDILVGAPLAGVGGEAYLFSGATGTPLQEFFSGIDINRRFGLVVAGAPDLNGDGRGDVVIGAPYAHDPGFTRIFDGHAVFVYSGATGELIRRHQGPLSHRFASAVGATRDLDGDGRGDYFFSVLPAPGVLSMDAPGVHVYSGATGALIARLAPPPGSEVSFGALVAGAADTNRNGRGDILVGAPRTTSGPGLAYLFKY